MCRAWASGARSVTAANGSTARHRQLSVHDSVATTVGRYRWATTAVITTADRGCEFAFTVVHDETGRDETRWRYHFEPSPSGTLLTESFDFVWCPLRNRVTELFIPRGRQLDRGIQQTLQRIKAAAESVHAT